MNIAFAAAAAALAGSPHPAKVPDLTGMWVLEPTLNTRVNPADIHLTPAAQAETDETMKKVLGGAWQPENHVRCQPAGMPQMMAAPFGIQIMQAPDRVMIMAEVSNLPRTIGIGLPKPDYAPSWNGYSAGRWDGEALAVETSDFNDSYAFLLNAIPIVRRTATLTIHERFSLEQGGKVLADEMVLEDPWTFTAPYRITYRYKRLEPTATLMEYVCDIDLPELTALETEQAGKASR